MSFVKCTMDPNSIRETDDDLSGNEDDWVEMEDDSSGERYVCLCCPDVLDDIKCFDEHMCGHGWKLSELFQPGKLTSFYDFLRFVNYLRAMKPACPADVFNEENWKDDEYLKPVLQDDAILCIDLEELGISLDENSLNGFPHNSELEELRIENLKLRETMCSMKDVMHRVVPAGNSALSDGDRTVGQLESEGGDSSYFESYSHYGIHAEMLADKVRTGSYQDFILRNAERCFRDRYVLDLGCGTGILSMFAATAGAQRVVGVDCADILYQAMDIVRENNLHQQITLVKGKLEEIQLPLEKVDVIISEWMGYFLLFESMLDSVIYARDNYLQSGGSIFPRHYSLHLLGCDDRELHNKNLNFWSDVYGFRMSCMRGLVLPEALVTVVRGESVATEAACIREFDLLSVESSDAEFSAEFSLTVTKEESDITGIVGYFDCDFDKEADHKVVFSTSPLATPTHWKQTIFLLNNAIRVKKGDIIRGTIEVHKHKKDLRGLEIVLKLGDVIQKYTMN